MHLIIVLPLKTTACCFLVPFNLLNNAFLVEKLCISITFCACLQCNKYDFCGLVFALLSYKDAGMSKSGKRLLMCNKREQQMDIWPPTEVCFDQRWRCYHHWAWASLYCITQSVKDSFPNVVLEFFLNHIASHVSRLHTPVCHPHFSPVTPSPHKQTPSILFWGGKNEIILLWGPRAVL